jgi:hypothetical protein
MSPGGRLEDYGVLGPPGTCAIDRLRIFCPADK